MEASCIWASRSQIENPVVKSVRRAKIGFEGDIGVFDFVPNPQLRIPVLFLSMKFHLAYRQYIGQRVSASVSVSSASPVVLLLLMDAEDESDKELEEITCLCVINSVRLLLAWSAEEGARILEILHMFGPDRASEIARGQFSRVTNESQWESLTKEALMSLQSGIGPKDSAKLLGHFGSLKNLILASENELGKVPSIGTKKSKHLFQSFS